MVLTKEVWLFSEHFIEERLLTVPKTGSCFTGSLSYPMRQLMMFADIRFFSHIRPNGGD